MKDDPGSYAVCTEQGSSASQITAAKVMDIISRPPGCAGQAADAVSACTRVKMEDAPTLLKIPKSECPKSWVQYERSGHSFRAKSVRSSFGRTGMGKAILESSIENTIGKKFPNWECLFVNREQGLFLSVYVDDLKCWKETKYQHHCGKYS